MRQKERFEPEAHLHGDIQSDLEFAGHPVFFLVFCLGLADFFARASARRFNKLVLNFLLLKDFCRRAAAAFRVFARPGPSS